MEENDVEEKKEESDFKEDVPAYVISKDAISKHKNKNHKKLFLVSIFLLLFFAVFVVYFVGVNKAKNVFDENTFINGVDVSGKTTDEARNLLENSESIYRMDIHFKNGEGKISLGDGGLKVIFERDIKELFDEQNPYLWFLNIGKSYDYALDFTLEYDEKEIKNYIDTFPEMDVKNMTPSVNSVVTMENGEVKISDDEEGTELNKAKVYSLILKAISEKEKAIDIAANDCYIPAENETNSRYIKACVENGRKYLSIKGVYTKDGEKIVEIPPRILSKVADFDAEGNVEIDYGKVKNYVMYIATLFPTEEYVSKTVTFITHKGIKKEISTRKTDWAFDVESETKALYENLQAMQDFERTPIYKSLESELESEIDVGDTYLELDLGEQHVFFYNKGEVVYDTLCVSGCVSWGCSTPAGYYVMGKPETNARLVGERNSYDTRVAYWMPFINQEIGLHDASWKSEFGGDIYKYDGSHGCINLSTEAAKKLFGMVHQGMPVIVYY